MQLYDGAIGQTRLAQAQVCPRAYPMQLCRERNPAVRDTPDRKIAARLLGGIDAYSPPQQILDAPGGLCPDSEM